MKSLHIQFIEYNIPIIIKPFANTKSFIKEWLIALELKGRISCLLIKPIMHKIFILNSNKIFLLTGEQNLVHIYNLNVSQSSITKIYCKN